MLHVATFFFNSFAKFQHGFIVDWDSESLWWTQCYSLWSVGDWEGGEKKKGTKGIAFADDHNKILVFIKDLKWWKQILK